ncbi:hypothetical protein BM1_04744 [Bipolaris maydis]|nr:hypothetical protein BM1_04744 [Bipolaris maydis]
MARSRINQYFGPDLQSTYSPSFNAQDSKISILNILMETHTRSCEIDLICEK